MHAEIVGRRKEGNPTHSVTCRGCLVHGGRNIHHPIHSGNHRDLLNAVADFKEKHLHCGRFVNETRWTAQGGVDGGRPRLVTDLVWKSNVEVQSVPIWTGEGWTGNADTKQAFQTEQTMTTTNLQSKASSATAGWTGTTVDNTTNLYLDTDIHFVIAAVNTAPGSNQAVYCWAFAGTNTTDVTPTGAASGGAPGTEGSLTFPTIATLPTVIPLLGLIPYPVQNAALGGHFNLARVYGLNPAFWGIAILNYTGFTLAASGNTIKYRGLYYTTI